MYEITMIRDENTITPNGYNIRPGGRYSYGDLPADLQQFYSNNIRIHKNFDLPPGLVEINLPHRGKTGEFGFRVIIAGRTYTFISCHQTMEEKLNEAFECYKVVKAGGEYVRKNSQKWDKDAVKDMELPTNITYRKDKDGFNVLVILNGKVYRKTFTKKKYTREENLNSAIEYLAALRDQISKAAPVILNEN